MVVVVVVVVLCRKQNAGFWLVCIAYSLSVSIYGVWSSLFGVILKDVLHEVGYFFLLLLVCCSINLVAVTSFHRKVMPSGECTWSGRPGNAYAAHYQFYQKFVIYSPFFIHVSCVLFHIFYAINWYYSIYVCCCSFTSVGWVLLPSHQAVSLRSFLAGRYIFYLLSFS